MDWFLYDRDHCCESFNEESHTNMLPYLRSNQKNLPQDPKPTKVESFAMSVFGLNKRCEKMQCLQKILKFKTFLELVCFIFERGFDVITNLKILKF